MGTSLRQRTISPTEQCSVEPLSSRVSFFEEDYTIAIQGTSYMAADKNLLAYRWSTHLYYYRSAVHKNLSSKCERFLAVRTKFDTVHGVEFYAPTFGLSATFVRPLFAFVLCFLRQKIINNFAFRHRCDF